jgi:hypothetical protein
VQCIAFSQVLTSNLSGIIKLQFTLDGQQQTHTVKLEDGLSFSELQLAASRRLGSAIENMVLEYIDSDGDRVRLEQSEDFVIAVEDQRQGGQANTKLKVMCSTNQIASRTSGQIYPWCITNQIA